MEGKRAPAPGRVSVELDRVLEEVGHFGPYQLRRFLAILPPIFFSAVYIAQYVFIAANVNYRCVVPECESSPPSWQAGAWGEWALLPGSKCSRRAPLVAGGPCTKENFGAGTQRCTAWVYQDNNTITAEFDLACDDLKRTMVGTVHSIGVLCALTFIGIVSDSIGRRLAFILAASLCALPGLARSFATSYYVYLVLEFLDPLLGAGVYTTGFVIAMEMVGTKRRVLCGGLIAVSFALGQATLALVAWLVPYWRTLTRLIYVPSFFFILYFCFFQESFRWLYSKSKTNEAIKILHNIAAVNRKPLSDASIKKLLEETGKSLDTQPTEKPKSMFRKMLQSRVLMVRLSICFYLWLSSTFIYYGLSINSVSLAGSMYVNYALMALVELPGYVLSVVTLDRFGRNKPIMAAYFFCGVFLIAMAFIPTERDSNDQLKMNAGGVAQVALALTGKLCVSGAFNAMYVLTSELFPTPVRHRAIAACSLVARIGQIVAMLTPMLLAVVPWLPFVLFGAMSVLAALLTLLTPETLHRPLPETVQEAEQLGRLRLPSPAPAAGASSSTGVQ